MINAAYIIIIKNSNRQGGSFHWFFSTFNVFILNMNWKKYINVKLWMKDTAKNIWTNLSTIFWQYQVS